MSQPNGKNEAGKDAQSIVVCEPNKPPTVHTLSLQPEFMDWDIEEMVGSGMELLPYPRQLGKKGLVVAVSEQGIARGLEQNRWGLVGTFVVYRQHANRKHPQGLDSETTNGVVKDLDRSYGYLDQACGVRLACSNGIGFSSSRAKRPDEFERQGSKWNPQFHFTGPVERHEMMFMNWLIHRHARGIVANAFYQPYAGMYSVELQFGPTEEDRLLMQECRRLYDDAFDDEGHLHAEIGQRPPVIRQATSPA